MSITESHKELFDEDGMLNGGKEEDTDKIDVEKGIKERAWDLMEKEINRLIEEHNLAVERKEIDLATTYWKSRNGQARYFEETKKKHYGGRVVTDKSFSNTHTLLVNRKILEEGNKKEYMDIIRHELAHIEAYLVYDNSGHDRDWKRMARKLGAKPKSRDTKFEGDYKYRIVCGNGCFDREYQRKCKTVKNPHRYRCRKCGEKLYRVDDKEEG